MQLVTRGVLEGLPKALSAEEKNGWESFILKTRGAQIADMISRRASGLYDVTYEVEPGSDPASPTISLEQRNLLKQKLPKPVSKRSCSDGKKGSDYCSHSIRLCLSLLYLLKVGRGSGCSMDYGTSRATTDCGLPGMPRDPSKYIKSVLRSWWLVVGHGQVMR